MSGVGGIAAGGQDSSQIGAASVQAQNQSGQASEDEKLTSQHWEKINKALTDEDQDIF